MSEKVASIDLDRLEEEEKALRSVSADQIALGHNASDYHNMAALFRQMVDRAAAMNADPTAFVNAKGQYDTRALLAWKALVSECRQILEGLSKMRNSDKLTAAILERHTREFSQSAAASLGAQIGDLLGKIDELDREEMRSMLKQLLSRGMPKAFSDAARATMETSRDQFALLN